MLNASANNVAQKTGVVNTNSKNSSEEMKQNRKESEAEAELTRLREQYNEAFRIEREAKKKVDAIGNFPRYDEMLDIISNKNNKEEIDSILAEYSKWQEESGYKAAYEELSNLEKNTRNLRRDIDVMEDNLSKALRERKYSEEEISSFVQKAVRKYHTTYSLNRAAYLLTTGSMLDFSEGQGYRVKDHREISEVLNLPEYAQYSDGMIVFMNMGNIRLQTYGIDISAMPNDKQISALRGIISSVMREYDEFTVDFSKPNGNSDGSVTYPKGVATSRIISDIKSYFETGKVPEYEDTLSQFMYSKRQEDADYLSAVERGDMETAQKMVDEAAKEAGYQIRGYHQTQNEFTVFDTLRKGAGASDNETPYGIFIKPTNNDIGLKGNIQLPLYAKAENLIEASDRNDLVSKIRRMSAKYSELYDDRKTLDIEYKKLIEDAEKAEFAYIKIWREQNPTALRTAIYEDAKFNELQDNEEKVIQEWERKGNNIDSKMKEEITRALRANGYDGVHLLKDRGSFGRSVETYILLDNNQVKSADPVTYDDNGNIIPLSQRFDSNKDDIRYSKRKENSTDPLYIYTEKEYNDYGWARGNEFLSAGENANYRAKFALLKSKQARFPKTQNGEYMIAVSDIYDYSLDGVENVIVYAKGTIDSPIITKVLRIDLYEESKTLDRRRREYYDAGRRGLQPKAGELCRFNYRTDAVSYEQYERNQFANNRHNGKFGINGETSSGKASQSKEIGRTEEGHIIYYHEDTQELSQNRIETHDP